MKAIQVSDDRSMNWTETPRPIPGPREVLIKIHATACNRADLLQRRGLYPPPEGETSIMGLEASGIIEALGKEVQSLQVGDPVACLLPGGGYAEYVAVHEAMVLPVPEKLSLTEAAAIPEVFYTAFLNIYLEGRCTPGETVLVHAAASGVGTAALQLCRVFGNPVIGTASQGKIRFLNELGVDLAIDRESEDIPARVSEFTGHQGVDLILDPVGANYFPSNLHLLREQGRLIIIGLLSGSESEISLGRLLRKRLQVIGSVLRSRSLAEKIEITKEFRSRVWPLFDDNKLHPIIDQILPIEEVEQAHRLLETNQTIGKVVLLVDSSNPG